MHLITDEQILNLIKEFPQLTNHSIIKEIENTRGKPEFITQIPEKMKRENWFYYVKARNESAEVIIPNTRNLISNLYNGMKLTNDFSRLNDMVQSIKDTEDAWFEFKENNNWGLATTLCWRVLDRISDMMQDPKWSTISNDSFVLPTNIERK